MFDYGIAHPGQPSKVYQGTDDEHFNEYGNPANVDQYVTLIKELGLEDFVASLWDSQSVGFLGEELLIKSGGKAGRSPWHQDTSYMPANGPHLLNIWISFERIPKENSLEIVRDSHRGVEYDGTSYFDPPDPTAPVWGAEYLPRLPDIETERKQDPTSWDVVSWGIEPGDALVFHSGTLHGGASVTPACPTRHTLVRRFFGDKLFYRPLPDKRANFGADASALNDPSLTPGDRYRSSYYA